MLDLCSKSRIYSLLSTRRSCPVSLSVNAHQRPPVAVVETILSVWCNVEACCSVVYIALNKVGMQEGHDESNMTTLSHDVLLGSEAQSALPIQADQWNSVRTFRLNKTKSKFSRLSKKT